MTNGASVTEFSRVDQPVQTLHADAPSDGFLRGAEGGVERAFEAAEVGERRWGEFGAVCWRFEGIVVVEGSELRID